MNQQITNLCKLIKTVIHSESSSLVNDEIDWAYMVQLSRGHNLLPILLEEAVKYPSYTSRSEYEKEMGQALSIVATQTKKTKAFLGLYRAFLEQDLHPLVMKGIICRKLYGKLCDHRPSGDEDILIRLCEYEKARDVLIANGYVSQMEVESCEQLEKLQEVSFIHPTEKLHIELHFNAMGRENDVRSRMSDYFKYVFEDYREVEIQGVQVRTMSHQNHLLYLILHAFKHFIGSGFGIRQMLDILMYHSQYRAEINVEKLCEVLREFKADIFWTDIVHIGNSYLGFKLPVLREPNCPQELLEDAINRGIFGNSTQAERTAGRTTSFVTGESKKNKESNLVLIIWRTLFPKKAYLLQQAPYLEKNPWLLPVAWLRRWCRFVKKSHNEQSNLVVESMKISQERMKLLKKYKLI